MTDKNADDAYSFLNNVGDQGKLNNFVRPAPSVRKVEVPQPNTPDEFNQFLATQTGKPVVDAVATNEFMPKTVVYGDQTEQKAPVGAPVQATVEIPEGKSSRDFFRPAEEKNDAGSSENPLKNYFRVAEAYVALPTRGKFSPAGSIEFTASGQVGVTPMTARDELNLRNPDALLNGSALEGLIKSCVPAVKNVRTLSIPDFDILLLTIRMVSYGKMLTYSTKCPECSHEGKASVNIADIIETIEPINEKTVTLSNGLLVTVKPYDFDSSIKQSMVTFEEQAMIRNVANSDDDENEKYLKIAESLGRIDDLTKGLFAQAVLKVETPDNQVITNHAFIEEFLANASKADYKAVTTAIAELNKSGYQHEVKVKCEKCEHEMPLSVTFDPSNFFVDSF